MQIDSSNQHLMEETGDDVPGLHGRSEIEAVILAAQQSALRTKDDAYLRCAGNGQNPPAPWKGADTPPGLGNLFSAYPNEGGSKKSLNARADSKNR